MATSRTNISEELTSVPLGDMIHSIATAIADGQFQLDKSSMRAAEFMGGQYLLRDMDSDRLLDKEGKGTNDPVIVDSRVYFGYSYDENGRRIANRLSMMELGFVPTFYQFVDTVIDIKLVLRLKKQGIAAETRHDVATGGKERRGRKATTVITATPVDARYTASYNIDADMISTVSTKLVPVPPPPVLEQRIRVLLEQEAAHRESKKGKTFGASFPASEFFIADKDIDLAKHSFTVELWIKRTIKGKTMVALFQGKAANNEGLHLGFRRNDKFMFSFYGNDLDTKQPYPETGEWHHWACVYDQQQKTRIIYRDGEAIERDIPTAGYSGSGKLMVGAQYDDKSHTKFKFEGEIAEVRIWDKAKSKDEITNAMNVSLKGDEAGLVGYWRYGDKR